MDAKRIPQQQPDAKSKKRRTDRPIPPDIYPVIDGDLARDNLENDIPYADLGDL